MTQWLSHTVVPLAWCWRVERRDGVTIGFTTHDAPLTIDNLVYRSQPGIRPSAIHQRGGLDGDSFDVDGALSSASISEADLIQGHWDVARLTLMVANWDSLDDDPIVIAEGRIGPVSSDGRRFTAELAVNDPVLGEPIVPETSAECRAELGDERCRVAMAGRTHRARVTNVSGDSLTVDASWPDGTLAFGRLRWLSGPLSGLTRPIATQSGAQITLDPSAAGPLAQFATALIGASVELREGCDKRAATCAARFANIANFRGEPHLPGMDLLTRFPGGS